MYLAHREIFEQGDILQESYNYVLSQKETILNFFNTHKFNEIVFVACGSSYWLSLSAVETFSQKFNVRCCAVTSGEIVMNPASYKNKFSRPLIIAPTRSGNTSETLSAIDFFRTHYGCPVLGVVEYPESLLSNKVDMLLNTPWANEKSVCQTRSFSNLYMITIMIAAIVKSDEILLNDIKAYLKQFAELSKRTEDSIQQIMHSHGSLNGLITLGHGKMYGIICEGAYITLEMAQSPAHFYYTLEFRHGPIVLLDHTYLIIMVSNGRHKELESKLIEEMQTKGAKILLISFDDNIVSADFKFTISTSSEEVVGLYSSFVAQAIAFYKALSLRVNPDKPKDLVPWIEIKA